MNLETLRLDVADYIATVTMIARRSTRRTRRRARS